MMWLVTMYCENGHPIIGGACTTEDREPDEQDTEALISTARQFLTEAAEKHNGNMLCTACGAPSSAMTLEPCTDPELEKAVRDAQANFGKTRQQRRDERIWKLRN